MKTVIAVYGCWVYKRDNIQYTDRECIRIFKKTELKEAIRYAKAQDNTYDKYLVQSIELPEDAYEYIIENN
jgi:hypothetical protein